MLIYMEQTLQIMPIEQANKLIQSGTVKIIKDVVNYIIIKDEN